MPPNESPSLTGEVYSDKGPKKMNILANHVPKHHHRLRQVRGGSESFLKFSNGGIGGRRTQYQSTPAEIDQNGRCSVVEERLSDEIPAKKVRIHPVRQRQPGHQTFRLFSGSERKKEQTQVTLGFQPSKKPSRQL
ncbi:uncharacterized protein PADG_03008 [Paracoccidioides brasiliensis Pb18]|uniref:Uncharacterized protein n=1 Tax=Paracoccidioides brasiliensis (strain Pb18) TaxID=502780 RepID=C1G753_PARBD|nr:uncharacterized protein PADG_03008 [Paracoccidioides brasiliensis Pb18]EEH46910.2 hypothetical protein PADG_03008 [Paracoccidioides brasiliensis Pb18]